jgi:hypothetical protein
VICSGGVDVTSGVVRANTSAPRTQKPRVSETCTRTDTGARRDVTTLGVKCTLSITSRAGRTTLVTGIEILPLESRICPSGPAGVVVVVAVVVVVVVGVDVDVDVDVELEVVEDVELDVVPVDVESVLLVVSASTLSGPAKPALAK